MSHPLVRSLSAPLLAVLLACAPSTSYRSTVPLAPSTAESSAGAYEDRAAATLAALGYVVEVDSTTLALRGERASDGGRDVIHVRRAAVRYGGGQYVVRFEYQVRAHSMHADRRFGPVRAAARTDVDRLTATLRELGAAGVPPWVASLTCAMTVAQDEGFRVRPRAPGPHRSTRVVYTDRYWASRAERATGPRLLLSARELYTPDAGEFDEIVVTPMADGSLNAWIWPPPTPRAQALRDRILHHCGAGPQVPESRAGLAPSPTEASASP